MTGFPVSLRYLSSILYTIPQSPQRFFVYTRGRVGIEE